jgi:hypothetical protein
MFQRKRKRFLTVRGVAATALEWFIIPINSKEGIIIPRSFVMAIVLDFESGKIADRFGLKLAEFTPINPEERFSPGEGTFVNFLINKTGRIDQTKPLPA